MTARPPTITAVICTRHRPRDLERALRSLASQDDPCDAILVVDDADPDRRAETRFAVRRAGVVADVVHKDAPGLTASRNAAIERVTTDLLMFLDDDVVLRPDYVAVVRAAFAADPGLAGAGGSVDDDHVYRWRWLRDVLMVPGSATGRVHRSGWSSPLPRGRTCPVQHLVGCNMTFRTAVLRATRFDEAFRGYALGEDLDLTHRLHLAGHRLVCLGDARLWHLTAPARHDESWGYREIAIRPVVAGRRFSRPCFTVAALTFLASSLVRNRPRARGNAAALRDVLAGRIATRADLACPGASHRHTMDKSAAEPPVRLRAAGGSGT